MVNGKLPEEMYFYLSNGDRLTSLDDLISFLDKDLQSVFDSHVNAQKNDFYNWVKFALKDESSAEKIKSAKTIPEMLNSLKNKSFNTQENVIKDSIIEKNDVEKSDVGLASVEKKEESNLLDEKVKSQKSKGLRARSKKAEKPKKPAKTKRVKTKHELSYSPDFDYSLDLDEQRDALAQIRKRIENMDLGLKSYSSSNNKNLAQKSANDKRSSNPKSPKDYFSKSFEDLDDKYPELSHKQINEEQLKELKGSKPRKKIHHHIKSASSHISNRVSHHAKKVHGYVSEKIEDAKKQAKIKKLVSSDKPKSQKSYISKKRDEEADNKKISYEMEKFYGKPIDDSDSNDSSRPKKKSGLFGKLINKFKKTESAIAKDLPDLHEFEHAKKAQEFLTSDVVVDANNYHLHGVQDFFKGLIIGILIGMLFLAIF